MAKIAIVDDSFDTLEILELILRDHHEFVTFAKPQEFLETFRPGVYALILLDLSMPGFDGYETLSRIRAQDKNVPVAALTATSGKDERDKAVRAGFCDYFEKPILELERFRHQVFSHVGQCANRPSKPEKPAA